MPIPAPSQTLSRGRVVARREDAEAFLTVINPSRKVIYRIALRITGNAADAEDVGQQTYLKAYNGIGQFTGVASSQGSRFAAWVSRIATNESIDAVRRRHRGRLISFDDPSPEPDGSSLLQRLKASVDDPEQRYARLELRRILATQIEQLDPSLRSVCLLRDVAQLSTQETADCLGISSAAVRIRLFRSRLKLRERMRQVISSPEGARRKAPRLAPGSAVPQFACCD